MDVFKRQKKALYASVTGKWLVFVFSTAAISSNTFLLQHLQLSSRVLKISSYILNAATECEDLIVRKPGWPSLFCHFLVKWVKWFGNFVRRSAFWLCNMLLCGCAHEKAHAEKMLTLDLTPLQEEKLRRLQLRLETTFDRTRREHQEALKALWHAAFPDIELRGLVSDQWKEMGWQGNDPSTDFRGGGYVSLENLLFFATKYQTTFQQLLCKKGGRRATWEYPFAVAGVNLTFMLIQMLDLRAAKPSSWSGLNFLKILAEEEAAFDLLYCVAFKVMDTLWLAMHASYMEFNAVMKATRAQLEQELTMESVGRIQDMPSYTLLH
ncbi:hypothetical protein GOP47_0016970 [Adiantum capillus-veneris]|uniref:ELMO domain-containing protein n=1 Tax=Adiantum capillus-veneris TaxID=13818 RepID=A0A9D4UIT5_ADICA|nr:hypothetical protein GOP47_0016970 [Adiantum capillus-veneris]